MPALAAHAKSGKLTRKTLVWKAGMANWVAASRAMTAAAVAIGGRPSGRAAGRTPRSRLRPAGSRPPRSGTSAQAAPHSASAPASRSVIAPG